MHVKSNDKIPGLGSQGDHTLVREINYLTQGNGVILNNLRV